jgi:hypothetical protein
MSGFLDSAKLGCGHENHVFVVAAGDEDRLLEVLSAVEKRREVLAGVAVGDPLGHERSSCDMYRNNVQFGNEGGQRWTRG